MNEECIENKRSYNEVHALEFLNEDRTSKKKKILLPHIIIVRTSFGLNPKQDWVLAQPAQTMNL